MTELVNGAPAEAELTGQIARAIQEGSRQEGFPTDECRVVDLAAGGITLGALKAVVRRCRLMVTNDTGPRHIAAAFGVPVVSLFGPTDERWTRIPVDEGKEAVLVADPSLPETEVADDHPDRCDVRRITVESVVEAASRLLG
jgi:heptosyltransferase-2